MSGSNQKPCAIYNEFGEVIYYSDNDDQGYKNKAITRKKRKNMPGQLLSSAIHGSGLTYSEVSNRTGISVQTISRMCKGDMFGSLESWIYVCDAIGIKISDVVED